MSRVVLCPATDPIRDDGRARTLRSRALVAARDDTCAVESHETSAIVLVDPTGVIRHWSSGATALFGHANALGETLDLIVPDDLRERHWAGFHRAMTSCESRLSGARLNIPIRCADDQVRSFPGTFSVLWDGHGRPVGAIGVFSERRGDEQPFSSIEPLR